MPNGTTSSPTCQLPKDVDDLGSTIFARSSKPSFTY
jgi:hypothetical protein